VHISIEAVIVPALNLWSLILFASVKKRLEAFLHPLTGGENSQMGF